MLRCLVIAAVVLVGHRAAAQDVRVDLKLVLAVDGSRSIDDREFALQIDGIAAAFRNPRFHEILRSFAPEGIAVAHVQWAGHRDQVRVVDWHHVTGPSSARDFAAKVAEAGRRVAPGPTGIGKAIEFSLALIDEPGFRAPRRVIDISADGYNNSGNRPEIARDEAVARGVTINGLTIENEAPNLNGYFFRRVIGGPDSFVVDTPDFESYAEAFLGKLIREIRGNRLAASAGSAAVQD